jgi:ATP-binding cassette, subfamily B, bacterial
LSDTDPTKDDTAPGRRKLPSSPRQLRPLASLWPYIGRYRGMLAAAAVALVASAAVMLAMPVAIRGMIDHGFSRSDAAAGGGAIDGYFLTLIALGLGLAVASAARMYAVNWLGERVVADLRARVFRHLATLGPAFYETTHSAEVMSRLTADTTQIKSAAGSSLSQALRNLIMLVGTLAMMVVTSPALAALALAAIPLIVFPLLTYGRAVQRLSRAAQDRLADASAYAADNLGAVRAMVAFGQEAAVSGRFAGAVEAAFAAAKARLIARAGLTAIAIALVVGSIVAVLWFGARMVVAGAMTGGQLGQFILYAVLAGGALAELSEVWGELASAAGAAERMMELLATPPQVLPPARPKPMPQPARGTIELRNVHFVYPSRPEVSALNGVTFSIAKGETVALVGPSGAGKSTIFNLILRFYDPQTGQVLVDGLCVDQVDPQALRSRIALVPQDTALFDDTVLENIRYGKADAGIEEVRRAAVAAHAHPFVLTLPDGYSTRLGERGVTLSGGQRQRIALARAVLRDAPILLLDEATSALDAESEAAVQQALERMTEHHTTLIIAHRLATVQRADRILVLDHGRIVEEGRHAELIRRGGLYARLAELQFALDAAQ